ncbi:hypothetical protein Syun_027646 [Stephania yunnanensis]|uniref:Uncharacterized protein n=1 Tax=Stephania yunnanensis TaxID=152371 RepID=A0AAP0EIB8_9MAGN
MVKFTVSVQGGLIGLVAAIISLTSKVVHNPKVEAIANDVIGQGCISNISALYVMLECQKAIGFYTEAIKLNGKNATYYGNRATVISGAWKRLQQELQAKPGLHTFDEVLALCDHLRILDRSETQRLFSEMDEALLVKGRSEVWY